MIKYGIKYKFPEDEIWSWDRFPDDKYVQYADINQAYQDYQGPKGYEWFVKEIPEELI